MKHIDEKEALYGGAVGGGKTGNYYAELERRGLIRRKSGIETVKRRYRTPGFGMDHKQTEVTKMKHIEDKRDPDLSDACHAAETIIYIMAIILGFCLYFYACPADAAGVSRGQVKKIVNQVINTRLPELVGPKGDPGPQGPEGPPGLSASQSLEGPGPQFLYAKILPNGEVDESRSSGITSADVQLFGAPEVRAPQTRIDFNPIAQSYCFRIPANGAQVTMDAEEVSQGASAGIFFLRKEGCEFFVRIVNRDLVRTASGFFITIY